MGRLLGRSLLVQECYMVPGPASSSQASQFLPEDRSYLANCMSQQKVGCSYYRYIPTSSYDNAQPLLPHAQALPCRNWMAILHLYMKSFLELWFIFFKSFHICLCSLKYPYNFCPLKISIFLRYYWFSC